jgi:hypothetical protein
VTRSYLDWVKREHEGLQTGLKGVTEGEVKDQFHTCGTRIRWWQGRKEGYRWTATGKEEYKSWWRRRVLITLADWEAGGDAIARAARSSWWEWDDGSTPFYWRWPAEYRYVMRDGIKIYSKRRPQDIDAPKGITRTP